MTDAQPHLRLHFLFPATSMNPLACRSLLSALVYGYEPILLNWGAKETGGKARQIKVHLDVEGTLVAATSLTLSTTQVQGVRDYLARNVTDPADLVFMVDAFGTSESSLVVISSVDWVPDSALAARRQTSGFSSRPRSLSTALSVFLRPRLLFDVPRLTFHSPADGRP